MADFKAPGCCQSAHSLSHSIVLDQKPAGRVEVVYIHDPPVEQYEIFLPE